VTTRRRKLFGLSGNSIVCQKCGKSYKTVGNLTRHEKYECGKAPSFGCSLCSYRAYYRYRMQKHLVACHYKKNIGVRLDQE
jgi:hypothetical protein